jgi:flagellar biosynthesis anti-sigma factor FlgM
MKIENNNISSANFNKTEASNQVEKQHSTSSSNNASTVSSKDKAELSDNARLLSKARIALNETPEVNQAKVTDLKAKIQNGNYNVPYEGLADKLYAKLGLR